MIAHIVGQVVEKFANDIIIDVHGVGYEVSVTSLDFDNTNLDTEVKFYTFHAIRENDEKLYGFSTLAAKKLFELLISVQGIGPKAAMSVLSLATPEEVRNALADSDVAFIAKATGVGKKSAERVIVDLKDKVGLPTSGRANSGVASISRPAQDEALDALIALGFPLKEATVALADIDPQLPTSERVRLALKS